MVEVRHGHWKTIAGATTSWLAYTHTCSVCKTSYKDLIYKGKNYSLESTEIEEPSAVNMFGQNAIVYKYKDDDLKNL